MSTESRRTLFALRIPPPPMTRRLVGAGAVGVVVLIWWLATAGVGAENRLVSPIILPSPAEVIRSFPSLLNERGLLQSIAATLRRVLIGFGLATAVGVPLGIVAGAWRVAQAGAAPIAPAGSLTGSSPRRRGRETGPVETRTGGGRCRTPAGR